MDSEKKQPFAIGVGIWLAVICLLFCLSAANIINGDLFEELRNRNKDTVKTFQPSATEATSPDNFITDTTIVVNDEITDNYQNEYDIQFGQADEYTEAAGIIGFRGNNYRDNAAYGTVSVTEKTLSAAWRAPTGYLDSWSGNGWTGQPMIVTWPYEIRQQMTAMHEWARSAEELTEVIYASLDGYIHFYELQTGNQTRDDMYLGFIFKGAGALDPRGYPMMYVGAGDGSDAGSARAFVINLLDNSVMYEFGNDDPWAMREWTAYDSSPLVDAENDMLIYPGENGILYLIHLNTVYDKEAGSLSVDPDKIIRWRYDSVRNDGEYAYWLGMETSAAAIDNYLFVADNSGYMMCLDLNTLKLVWVQDILDDTNDSPVISVEDGHPYIYISTSYHYGWRSTGKEVIPVYKIDAENGEIIWQTEYYCYSVDGVSGGVQGTIASGKNNVDDLIFVPVSRTPEAESGVLAAISKSTGEVVWEFPTQSFSWSSPTLFYDDQGKGYLLCSELFDKFYLIDAADGTVLNSLSCGGVIESSPAIYGNYAVVGTRDQGIWGIEIK